MGFFREICRAISAEAGAGVQYTVTEGKGGYFQNVKRIAEFSPSRIVLLGKKGGVAIDGTELSLGKYYGGDAVVCGAIAQVTRLGDR